MPTAQTRLESSSHLGTSSSNPGPTGRPPLLPPWAPDAPPGDDAPETESESSQDAISPPDGAQAPTAAPESTAPSWNGPRRLIGTAASGRAGGRAGRNNVRKAVRGALGSMGGARAATRSSIAGRSTAGRLSAFLNAAVGSGIAAAARSFGLSEYIGKSSELFLAKLVDVIAPAGGLTEEAIARSAAAATLQELFDTLEMEKDGVARLESLSDQMLADTLVRFVVNYIYERILNALTAHLHWTGKSHQHIREVEVTARDYIEVAVRTDLGDPIRRALATQGDSFDWTSSSGERLIAQVFEETMKVVEAGINHDERA